MNLFLQIQSLQLLIFFMNDEEFMANLDYLDYEFVFADPEPAIINILYE